MSGTLYRIPAPVGDCPLCKLPLSGTIAAEVTLSPIAAEVLMSSGTAGASLRAVGVTIERHDCTPVGAW